MRLGPAALPPAQRAMAALAAAAVLAVAAPAGAQGFGDAPLGQAPPAPVPTTLELEYLPGQGRESRAFTLLRVPGEAEYYLDLWDAVRILQASRYFDPVTRKAALGVGEHRVKLTDDSPWIYLDGVGRRLGAPCRIAEGRFYVPLSFWSALLETWPELPLRRDPEAYRLLGGLGSVNVLGVQWYPDGERLRAVFRLGEPLAPRAEKLGEQRLRLRFPGGRLAAGPWDPPAEAPIDSLRAGEEAGSAWIDLYFSRPPAELRSSGDPRAGTWAFACLVPARPGAPEPEFEGEIPALPLGEGGPPRRLVRIVLDPGHGGADSGCVAGEEQEKRWNLDLARWLEPFLAREGFTVSWTRRDDSELSAGGRAQAANASEGDLFLSLHFTRRGRDGEAGLEIVLPPALAAPATAQEKLRPWHAVQTAHVAAGLDLAGALQSDLREDSDWPQLGIRHEASAVLEGVDMPALMLEAGNLDDAGEREAWRDPAIRGPRLRALAQSLAEQARRWRKGAPR